MDDSRDSRRDAPPAGGQILHLRRIDAVRGPDPDADLSCHHLFTVLWDALADVLGTAAAAALLRRAAQRATLHCPELTGLSITRESLEYRFVVPAAWNDPAHAQGRVALCALTTALWPLLVDLTGSVVTNRLAQIPALRDRGVVPRREEQP